MLKFKKKVSLVEPNIKRAKEKIDKIVEVTHVDPKFYFHKKKCKVPFSDLDYKNLKPVEISTGHTKGIIKFAVDLEKR